METLAELIKRRMDALGLDRLEVVERMGYENRNKGLNRLDDWRAGGLPRSREQLQWLAEALEVGEEKLKTTRQETERKQKQKSLGKRADDPNYHLIVRLIPGFYNIIKISGELTEEQARSESKNRLKELGKRGILNTPDSRNFWLDSEGRITGAGKENSRPAGMRLKSRPFRARLGE